MEGKEWKDVYWDGSWRATGCGAGMWVKVWRTRAHGESFGCGNQELRNVGGMYGQMNWQAQRLKRSLVVVVVKILSCILHFQGFHKRVLSRGQAPVPSVVCRYHTSGTRGVGV